MSPTARFLLSPGMLSTRFEARCRTAVLVALTVLASACSTPGYRDAGPELAQLAPLADDPRVRHDTGGEAYARQVATLLDAAIARVERLHGQPFRSPPRVHVCASLACFERFVPRELNLTAAVVYANRLVLAPRLHHGEPQRLEPILVHELSHLHLGQRLGHYTLAIPVWFHEGLASLAADGGGADLTSDEEARAAIDAGRHFLPEPLHRPWTRMMAPAWRLGTSLFYRQAMMFVSHLRTTRPWQFHSLLARLQQGEEFDATFAELFGASAEIAAKLYFGGLAALEPAR